MLLMSLVLTHFIRHPIFHTNQQQTPFLLRVNFSFAERASYGVIWVILTFS